MSTDKTLADVKPGGRVRLGDQAERARFEAWPQAREFEIQKDGSGEYLSEVTHGAWLAWKYLSAQPRPGGQDALAALQQDYDKLLDSFNRQVEVAEKIAGRALQQDDRIEELEEALAVRQPVGPEPLWCLHVLGMDDVHPAPSKAHAEKAAAWHNEQFKDQAARLGISIEAKVVPWPHSAESHAAGVAEFIPQWLIPQWQLDALEANAAPPAQAVDLGAVREAVRKAWQKCAAGESVDLQFGTLLALIDSQAVGK